MADAGREATVAAEKETAALKKLQAAAGFSTGHVERLDWMYEQSVTAKPDDDKLMNMAVAGQSDKDLEDVKKLQENTAGSLFLKSATKTTEDMLRKLREDPLFQIKRQEQAARENMMANPLVVAKLQKKQAKASKKAEKKAKKAAQKAKKAMKKAAKKDKKARKKAGEKVSSSSSSSSPSSSSEGAKPGSAQMAATLSAMMRGRGGGSGSGSGGGDVTASSSVKRPRSRSASPFGRGENLGPSASVVDKRAEHARQIAERRDAALASRGATKRLGEEERQRKLEQMRSDAQTHERTKDHRIARAEQRDKEEMEKEEEMRKNSDQRYFREMREKAYMGDSNATMADRLKNQRHRRQKNLNDPLERDG
eukprot:CAMPEP_0206458376 /NCGR_PEP_ID=MMETSP0324_2-20121206/23533_1 /ASSEMBLY_ACC=CAM_ASM_000836 /TAXON_ID=2866 /ORGANISM="Crypthecodinium cohnii, Strain Seligo" /LENGTH=365 /DNA_ID=CAMNT_0053929703 /DNA_START=13 /DNA_END=1110 /DNA_ORIENTATION=+